MGFFDQLKKSFDNKDYTNSPATYEQTNARASHILVDEESLATEIKEKLKSGDLDFASAAVEYSTCASASRGGKLGKFGPGKMEVLESFLIPTRITIRSMVEKGDLSVYLMPMGLNSSKKFSRGSKVLRKKTSSKAKEMFLIRNGS